MSPKDPYQSQEYQAPFIRIRGRVSRQGEVRWSPCLRTDKRSPARDHPPTDDRDPALTAVTIRSPYAVLLLDYRDEVLAAAPAKPVFFSRSQEWATFVVRIPYQEHVQSVRLMHNQREVGTLRVPTCRPYFTFLRPREDSFIDPKGVLHLHWANHDSQQPLTYFVRYSHNGRDWLRPGVNLHTTDYYLDLRELPGGPHCVVQVLATNGYRTSFVQTRHFDVAVKPLDIMLGETTGPVLFAQGYSREAGPLTGDRIAWLDGTGRVVHRGGTLDVRTLLRGTPHVSVRVEFSPAISRTELIGVYDGATGLRIGPTEIL